MNISRHITELKVRGILRLVAVHITPNGNVVTLTGRNAQGKSSVLESIWMALGGKNAIPPKPIHEGEEKGTIELTLGDLVVKRSFTAANTYLTVETKDGASYKSPQAMLDKLLGNQAIEPSAFLGLDPKKQRELLCQLLGLDFTSLDTERMTAYNSRRDLNRDLDRMRSEIGAMPIHENLPEVPSTEAIRKQIQDAEAKNTALVEQQAAFAKIRQTRENAQSFLEVLKDNEKKLEAELTALRERITNGQSQVTTMLADEAKAAADLTDRKPIDTAAFYEKIETANQLATKKEANDRRDKAVAQFQTIEKQANDLTTRLAAIDKEKLETIQKAKFPVEGLGLSDDGVTYEGLPFSQASDAMKIRISVAIASCLHKDLRILIVRNGSLLDSENLKLLHQLAEEHDLQVWIEKVEDDDPTAIVIEDGSVKGAAPVTD